MSLVYDGQYSLQLLDPILGDSSGLAKPISHDFLYSADWAVGIVGDITDTVGSCPEGPFHSESCFPAARMFAC